MVFAKTLTLKVKQLVIHQPLEPSPSTINLFRLLPPFYHHVAITSPPPFRHTPSSSFSDSVRYLLLLCITMAMDRYRDFFLTPVPQQDYTLPAFQHHFALMEKDARGAYKSSLQWVLKNHSEVISSDRIAILKKMLKKYVHRKGNRTQTIRNSIRGNNNLIAGGNVAVGVGFPPNTGMGMGMFGAMQTATAEVGTLPSPLPVQPKTATPPQALPEPPPLQRQDAPLPVISESEESDDGDNYYDDNDDLDDDGYDDAPSLPSTRILPRSPSPLPLELTITTPYHQSNLQIPDTLKHLLQNGQYLEDHLACISQFAPASSSSRGSERHALINLGIVDLDDHIWLHYSAEVISRLKWGLPKTEMAMREFWFAEMEAEREGCWDRGLAETRVPSLCSGSGSGGGRDETKAVAGKIAKWYSSAVVHLRLLDMLWQRAWADGGGGGADSTGLCESPEHSMLLLDSVFAISGKFRRQKFTDTPFISDYLPSGSTLPPDAFAYVHIDRQVPFAFTLPVYSHCSSSHYYPLSTAITTTTTFPPIPNGALTTTSYQQPNCHPNPNPHPSNSSNNHSGPFNRLSLIVAMHTTLAHLRKTLLQLHPPQPEDISVCGFLCYAKKIDVLVLRAHGRYSQVLKMNRIVLDFQTGKETLVKLFQAAGHAEGLARVYETWFRG